MAIEDEFEFHGWRGIGVPMQTVDSEGFIAVGRPPGTREVAVSGWIETPPAQRRVFAFWVDPESARKLGEELIRMADGED